MENRKKDHPKIGPIKRGESFSLAVWWPPRENDPGGAAMGAGMARRQLNGG